MIWIRNGIRVTRNMARDGLMIPPEVITRERSLQGLTLRMIERQILHCLLGPRRRTYDPQNDYTQAASSGDQWKPRLRSEAEMSSVAGDTSEASAAAYRLKSIHESEGDAVKGSRSDAGYRW